MTQLTTSELIEQLERQKEVAKLQYINPELWINFIEDIIAKLLAAEEMATALDTIKTIINPILAREFSQEKQIQTECNRALAAWHKAGGQ